MFVNQNSRRRLDKAHCPIEQSVLWLEPADLNQFDSSKISALTAEELVDGLIREMELIERHERRRNAGAIALWSAIQQRRQRRDAEDSRDAA